MNIPISEKLRSDKWKSFSTDEKKVFDHAQPHSRTIKILLNFYVDDKRKYYDRVFTQPMVVK